MGEDSLTIGWQWDWAFASSARFGWWQHRPPLLNYSLGNAIIRHKGLSFASALWKPGDINCRASLPSPVPLPLPRSLSSSRGSSRPPPQPTFSTYHPCSVYPAPRVPLPRARAPNIPRITYSTLIRFCPVLAAEHPSISPPCPLCKLVAQAAASKHSRARATNATPKDRLKCSRVQEMFFKHTICQVTLNVAKQWYGGSRWRIPRRNVFAHYIASINLF